MKAAVYYENGGPEVLKYEDAPDPQLHPSGVLIKVEAIAIEGEVTGLDRRNGEAKVGEVGLDQVTDGLGAPAAQPRWPVEAVEGAFDRHAKGVDLLEVALVTGPVGEPADGGVDGGVCLSRALAQHPTSLTCHAPTPGQDSHERLLCGLVATAFDTSAEKMRGRRTVPS